eukprot:snap_masked-scaffold_20-processed-gene-4.27-mRNA-1 protein AED:1.00 eAED:1.00 QI:0/-1/0/0/-1/1/1/0/92
MPCLPFSVLPKGFGPRVPEVMRKTKGLMRFTSIFGFPKASSYDMKDHPTEVGPRKEVEVEVIDTDNLKGDKTETVEGYFLFLLLSPLLCDGP